MKLQPGPALDELLCKAAGIEPADVRTHEYWHHDGTPKASCDCGATFWATPRGEWCPLGAAIYPPVSTTGDGMLLLMAALEARWMCSSTSMIDGRLFAGDLGLRSALDDGGRYEVDKTFFMAYHATRTGAFAYAAAQALGVDVEVSE